MMRRLWGACALLAACSVACGKTGARSRDEATSEGGSVGNSGGSSAGGSRAGPPPELPPEDCRSPGPNPGSTPPLLLSNFELNRSVRALLGDAQASSAPWLSEETYGILPSSAPPAGFEQELHALAHAAALELTKDAATIQSLSGCDPMTSGEDTCARRFVDAFLARAYRRPATREDGDDMLTVFAEGQRLGGDFASGARAVVEVALQSPEFAYLLELGSGKSSSEAVALTGSESAARLAYFLTGAPPDAELAAAAAKGSFSADDLESQARRLLGSPASRELVRHFYAQLLRLSYLPENTELGFTTALAASAREETARFVEDVTFDGAGTFRALLTDPSTWVDGPLATLYGLPGVHGAEFQKVALDPAQRGGILTQAAFLRAKSHSNSTSPVHRGLAVLNQLLCYQAPPPPPDITLSPPSEASPNATMRERLSAATQDPACQSCHRDIDPLGFAFEHYDAVGRWRDTENGRPIDASGELYRSDAQGQFADAIELLQRIADSDDAKACFVGHWFQQAYRRAAEPADACAVKQVSQAFADSDGNLVELMVALSKGDNFRYRLNSELAP